MGRSEREGPLHEVHVRALYMGRYPVTNEEYGEFLEAVDGVSEPRYWNDSRFNRPRQPVVGVSRDEVRRYAEWVGLRLPSEAEWEYACRAGTRTRYHTGDADADLDRAGWHAANSGGRLHAVGGKAPNAFGLFDMHGNVLEWVEDDYHKDYCGAPADGSPWVDERRGYFRVLRGGCWSNPAELCRAAYRNWFSPDSRDLIVGFRLCKSVPLDH